MATPRRNITRRNTQGNRGRSQGAGTSSTAQRLVSKYRVSPEDASLIVRKHGAAAHELASMYLRLGTLNMSGEHLAKAALAMNSRDVTDVEKWFTFDSLMKSLDNDAEKAVYAMELNLSAEALRRMEPNAKTLEGLKALAFLKNGL